MRNIEDRIVVTGGGSGGHVSCASAIISGLQERYNLTDQNFMYVGGDLGLSGERDSKSLEMKYFEKANFNTKYIRAGKLQRVFSVKTILLLLRTILGFADSFKIFRKFKPTVIISTGGFTSVPVCIVGKIFGAKIYIHEQTATVGLANKIVSKISEKIFLTYQISEKYFKKEKTIYTGCPVRKSIFSKEGTGEHTSDFKEMIAKKEKLPIIYVSGGGLGSHLINKVVIQNLSKLLQKYQIVLQTGESKTYNDFDLAKEEKENLAEELKDRFLPVKYITEEWIGFLYNNIDIYVGRAGANSVYEIGVLQIPSVFIPIPWVTHNEQEENAKILVNLGLSTIINESSLSIDTLLEALEKTDLKNSGIDTVKLGETFKTNAVEDILNSIYIK